MLVLFLLYHIINPFSICILVNQIISTWIFLTGLMNNYFSI